MPGRASKAKFRDEGLGRFLEDKLKHPSKDVDFLEWRSRPYLLHGSNESAKDQSRVVPMLPVKNAEHSLKRLETHARPSSFGKDFC